MLIIALLRRIVCKTSLIKQYYKWSVIS